MFTSGTHKTLANSLESIGAAFAIVELQRDSGDPVLVTANSLFEQLSYKPVADCVDRPLAEFFPRYIEKILRPILSQCISTQEPQEDELAVERAGSTRWWRLVASPLVSTATKTQRVIMTLIEISEKKRLEQELETSRQRFEAVVQTAYDGVISIDGTQTIKLMNESARYIFGVGDENVIGTNLSRFLPQRFRAKHPEYLASFKGSSVDARPMESRTPVRGLRKDGTEFPLEVTISKIRVGNDIEMTAVIRDISERMRLIDELSRAATHDALTGIFNRRLADTALRNEISRCQRFGHAMSVALFDLDHFKQINDTRGHTCGDQVLKAITAAVSETLRDIDVFCRWGGEEFLVILPETTLEDATVWAERARALIAGMNHTGCDGKPVSVTASFGLATFNKQNADPVKLVASADAALYRAKESGRNRVLIE